ADVFNRRIRKIDISGRVTTFAGNGTPGTLGNGGPALNAQVVADRVRVVNTKSGGTLVYLSDEINNTIRVIDEKGIINRVAGGGGTPPREGIIATFLDLNEPRGLGIDATGNLYVGANIPPQYIWKILARFPEYSSQDILVPSPSGDEVFRFGPEGRHLKTYNAFTGKETLSFAYSPAGRLTHITDVFGNVTEITRSVDGHPTALVNPYGQTLELSSDLDGNLLEVTLPSGASHAFTYDALGLMATYRTPGNHAYGFTYDDLGRLIRDDDPAGGHQTLARVDTTGGVMTTVTSALGRTTIYRLLHGQDFTQTDLMLDPAGLPTAKFTTGAGVETTYHPDDTEVEVLLGPDPQLGYQGLRREEIRARTPDGLELSVSNQRTVVLADSLNPLSLRTYFESKYVNGLEYVTRYVDSLRMWTTQTPVGRVDTVLVDSLGRLVETRVPGRESRTYAYDSRGRLASVTQGQGDQARVTEFTYNTAGRLSTIEDAEGRVFQYTHDVDGRVIRETLPDGREVEYTHDADGNVASVAPPGRPTHFFDYNSLGLDSLYDPPALGAGNWTTSTGYNLDRQLLAINQPASRTIAYRYDAAGRLDSVILASGSYVLSFNATSGHLDSLASPYGVTTSYAYDGPLVTGVTWSGGVTGSLTVAYDDDFRPISQSVNGSAPIETAYDFDGLPTQVGGLTLARHPKNGRVLSTVLGTVVDSLTYSAFGDLGAYLAKSGSDTLFHAEYQRDKLGRIVQKTEKVQGVTKVHKYVYDPAGRLREAVLDGVDTVRYAYDSNGNRLARVHPLGVDSGRYDDQDRLLDYDGRQFTHNANGDLATMIQGADTTTYDYDAFGNLVAVELPDGTGIEYVIDGQNRRVGRKLNGVLRQGFLYQGQLEPIAELDSAGNVVARFIYANHSHVPDYMIKGGVTYRIISDHLGSPRLIANASTGGVAKRIDYDEFGVMTYNSNPGFQPFGFAGGIVDPSTDLTKFGVRDYHSVPGRWTNKDPIRFLSAETNLYAYVNNEPINAIDPQGLISVSIGGGAGWGGEVTFGYDKCGWFMEGVFGIGAGLGISVDPFGSYSGPKGTSGYIGGAIKGTGTVPIVGGVGPGVAVDLKGALGFGTKDGVLDSKTSANDWGPDFDGIGGGGASIVGGAAAGFSQNKGCDCNK
ncbi:MAG TPA: RHS repeat-associated core domain-containing protein, partial [Fibrobacteria bacterium]|nr:RHS repeat-associated core domain-containing protein [Fibrobacteria bacterium]